MFIIIGIDGVEDCVCKDSCVIVHHQFLYLISLYVAVDNVIYENKLILEE